MFERFTANARATVVDAQEQARSLHHRQILPEHLLLAVLHDDASISARVLRDHHVEPDRLKSELVALGVGDDDALREIGIDLDSVRQRAEASFGPGALDRPLPRRPGLLRRLSWTGGHLAFSDAAKHALEQSLRQAVALGNRSITTDHVLLGLLADEQNPASRLLHICGASPDAIEEQVRAELRQAA